MAKKQFKAESKRLLDLMVNSIYTHKEIFLRELISNASDAIDKLNYKSLTDAAVKVPAGGFCIGVRTDKDARTLTISDNGIGMTADEVEKDLGVIAHSGTLEFKTAVAAEQPQGAAKDATAPAVDNGAKDEEKAGASVKADSQGNPIGQFGVGFYSAFMVADKVAVVSRSYKLGPEGAVRWESAGIDGYTLGEATRSTPGTDIILHLKADADGEEYSEYLDTGRLKELAQKYSDYIRWPIHMDIAKSEWKETGEKDKDGNLLTEKDGTPKKGYVTTVKDETVNSMVPIWRKTKAEADDKACGEFYKTKFRDYDDPIAVIRVSAEGLTSYKALLFIPKKAPYDFYTRDFQPGLQLYSNGVLIMDKCADMLPYCFRFVRGVVDSPDFSLNLSREVLQHDRQLKDIASHLAKKVKEELARLMADQPEVYREFYASFGRQLKYGAVDQYGANKDLLQDLLMFESAKDSKLITLAEYVKAMPTDQKSIYYVTAENVGHAKALPQTEPLTAKGYDFLCLTEDIDTFVMRALNEYQEKPFCNATSEDLGLETEEEKKAVEQKDEEYKDLLAFAKETLGDGVAAVRISHKLKTRPVLLTTQGEITFEMEKYFADMPGKAGDGVKAARVLELNADSPAFKALNDAFAADKDKAAKLVRVMYGQACIVAGIPLDDTAAYSDLVFSLF